MASFRTVISRFIGGIQCFLGAVSAVLSFLVYASQPFRESLDIDLQEASLFMLLFMVFSVFSIVSGLILIREESEGGSWT